MSSASASSSAGLQRDVLERRGVRKVGDQAEPRLSDPGSDTVDKAELPDRRVNHPLGEYLLHLVEDCRAFLMVELSRLLLGERIDVGVAAIDIGAALHDERFQPGR